MTQRCDTYKDSGAQWLGKIPGHWGCVALKRICKMKSNNLTSLDILDKGDFPVYGANGFRGYYNQYNKEGKYILIGRQGALAGNVHLVKGKFWAADHAVVTTITSDKVFTDYLALSLDSLNLNQCAFDTAAEPGLAVSKIISFSSPLPPLSEQRAVVSYITERTAKIDKMVENVNRQPQRIQAASYQRRGYRTDPPRHWLSTLMVISLRIEESLRVCSNMLENCENMTSPKRNGC